MCKSLGGVSKPEWPLVSLAAFTMIRTPQSHFFPFSTASPLYVSDDEAFDDNDDGDDDYIPCSFFILFSCPSSTTLYTGWAITFKLAWLRGLRACLMHTGGQSIVMVLCFSPE